MKTIRGKAIISGFLFFLILQQGPALGSEETISPNGLNDPVFEKKTPLQEDKTLHVRGDSNYPPFEYLNKQGRPEGFNIDILHAIADVMGMKIRIDLGPWDQVRAQLERGDIDALMGMFKTQEREKKVDFSIPHFITSYALFVRNDSKITCLEDVIKNNSEIIVQSGDLGHDFVRGNNISSHIITKTDWADTLTSLSRGDGDCAIVSRLQGTKLIDALHISNIKAVGPPIIQREYCLAVTRGNSSLLAELNEGLSIIKTNGTYDALYEKWFGVAAKGPFTIIDALKYFIWVLLPLLTIASFGFLWSWLLKKQVAIKTNELRKELHERELIEEALRESRQRLFDIIEFLPDATFVIDRGKRVIAWNHALEEMTGVRKEDIICKGNYEYSMPFYGDRRPILIDLIEEQNPETEKLYDRLIRYDRTICAEVYVPRLYKGRGAWTMVMASPLVDDHNNVYGAIETVRDITGLKQAEKESRDMLSFLQILIDTIPSPIFYKDTEGIYQGCNKAFEDLLGLKKADILGKSVYDIYPRDLADKYYQMDSALLRQPGEQVYEHQIMSADEKRHDVIFNKATYVNAEGTPMGLVGVMIDITERKQAEMGLIRLSSAINNIDEMIIITDTQGIIQYVNPAFERTTGYSQDEALGASMHILESGRHDKKFYQQIQQTISRGETWKGHVINKKKDGSLYDVEATLSCVKAPDGTIGNYISVQRDVTQHMKLEQQYRQSQKMEAIGSLAGGIAHDFNNILAAILGYTQIALDEVSDRPQAEKYLQEVLKATDRATKLVKQILTFSRMTEQEKKPVMPRLIIKEALKLLRASLPTTIEIRQNVKSDAVILGDPTQIHQIAMNLCTNAGYAMREKGGVLEVTLDDIDLDSDFAQLHPGIRPGKHVRLHVADTGSGIPHEIIDRIFDPFFTTKAQDEGTGLGLSVVHGIVKASGGSISVYSEINRGTTFNIYLPSIQAEASREVRDMTAIPRGTEKILFVDDEPSIIDTGRVMLESLGYRVTACNSSITAFDTFKNDPQNFDAVITDYTMPQMTGLELAQKINKIRNTTPVILCTGFSETVTKEKAQAAGLKAVLFKPFKKREIAEKIRTIFDGNTG